MNRTARLAVRPAARRASHLAVRGFTLVESAIVLCIGAIAVSAVAPSFDRAVQRRHLEGSAAQLATDLQYARSAAVARSATVRVSFQAAGGASCYVVHTGSAGDCPCVATAIPVCRGGAEALHTVRFDTTSSVQVVSNASSMLFDPDRGTVTPTGTIKVLARNGSALHQVVNVMGRARTCSPAPALPGYSAC